MTALLLLVTLVLTFGATAFLTYLVVDAALTEPLREPLLTHLRGPAQQKYEEELDDYRTRVQEALTADHAIPVDAPHPPADPWSVKLLTCRWCAGTWISLLVIPLVRLLLTADYPPLWYGLPLHPLDPIVLLGWALANAYAVGFLASREGD